MAAKRNVPTRFDPINLPRRLREGLEDAERLLAQNKTQEALDVLQDLDQKFPRQPDVLGLAAKAYLDQ